MSPSLLQTLRVLDSLPETNEVVEEVNGPWVDRLDQILKDEGRAVPRAVLVATAEAVLAPPEKSAPPALPGDHGKPQRGWHRWLAWWRSWRVRWAASHPKGLTWEDWQKARADQKIERPEVPTALAVAYWKVRRARMGAREGQSLMGWIWNSLTRPDERTLPVKSAHQMRLFEAMKKDGACHPLDTWTPCHYHDEPYSAFSHAPLLVECIQDRLTWDTGGVQDDLPLFEHLLTWGANPDALFNQMPLPISWLESRAMSVREACLATFCVDVLRRLPPRTTPLLSIYDSQLWWALGVHAEENNVRLWARLRDEDHRWLPKIAATVEWVLAHETAPELHEVILRKAIQANATWRLMLASYLDRVRHRSG